MGTLPGGGLADLVIRRPDPTVIGSVGKLSVFATLTPRGARVRLPSYKVNFYLTGPSGGRQLHESVNTNPDDGTASTDLSGLQPGGYRIDAEVEGSDVASGERFTVPLVQRQKPHKVAVSFNGPDGKQKLHISVSTEEGIIIPSFVVMVIEGSEATSHDTSKPYPMNFTEDSRAVEVRAGNTKDLVWQGRLLGPQTT